MNIRTNAHAPPHPPCDGSGDVERAVAVLMALILCDHATAHHLLDAAARHTATGPETLPYALRTGSGLPPELQDTLQPALESPGTGRVSDLV
ncbi:hypothetical protein GCM10010302_04870 [Streptomyces polychromogenes]|uniref:Uncharacterized protein n=1 Tax=Streptomyces polychromogenes TaxID=67342 RepID=A0ABN0V1J5_9ACTN